ncbi:MAG: HPP family protein [Halobacteriales archaeon]
MLDTLPSRVHDAVDRLRRFERRELRDLHRWLEDTRHLLLLSTLVAIPLLMGVLTYLSNVLELLPYLLFPPLASGAYTLFAQPASRYASPRRFVGGMTLGALSGWVALELTARFWYHVAPETFSVHPGAAAFGVLLAGVATWALDLQEAQTFSTALLVLVTGANEFVYVLSIFVSSTLVAGAFVVWQREVYGRRAELLYGTVRTDDRILVPVRGDGTTVDVVAGFAAQLAAPHEAGKVVLLDVVTEDEPWSAEGAEARRAVASEAEDRLADLADRLQSRFAVPCETAVAAAGGDDATAVTQLATETGSDLVVVPLEVDEDRLSPFVRTLFDGPHDVVAARLTGDRDVWRRVLVPVRRDGEVAHAMVDFAQRLAGEAGSVTVCHCLEGERGRLDAESMLANVVDQFERALETRVAATAIESFLAENCGHYDLTLVGASRDRSAASRVLSPPTFRQLADLEGDFAVVDRGSR